MDTALPAGGDRDQGPKVLAISWTFSALTLLLYTSGLWSKARITHNTNSDDALTGVSLVELPLERPCHLADFRLDPSYHCCCFLVCSRSLWTWSTRTLSRPKNVPKSNSIGDFF